MKIKLAGLIIGLLIISLGGVASIVYINKGGPMKLTSVCTGQNTNIVKCTWIPLNDKDRTIEEKELAKLALKD